MSTLKQKNIIKTKKLWLQGKLKTVTEETEKTTSHLNNIVDEFRTRVQRILEIKDENCFSSLYYEKLIQDLEKFSENLFILRASFGDTEDDSDSEDDVLSTGVSEAKPNLLSSSDNENISEISSCPLENSRDKNQKVDLQIHSKNSHSESHSENADLQRHAENTDLQKNANNVGLQISPEGHSMSHQACVKESATDSSLGTTCSSHDEDDFYSLNSDNVRGSVSFISQLCNNEPVLANEHASINSFSQSSCYRSVSSNFSEPLAIHCVTQFVEAFSADASNKFSSESLDNNLVIPSPNVQVLSRFSGTLSHIIDPGNFWIQIENDNNSKFTFPKSEYVHSKGLSSIKKGSYCLTPFKLAPFYYRSQALSDGKSEKELVTVLCIDHGSTLKIAVCDLRSLPQSAYDVPAQAIRCYLYGILPTTESWSEGCTERFKDFQNFCIDAVVKSIDNSCGVQLVAKVSTDLVGDFSLDIAEALCLDGLAVSSNDHQLPYESQLPEAICPTASSLELSGSYDKNAISNDSGVSVTSTYKSSQVFNKRNEIFSKASEDCVPRVATPDRDSDEVEMQIKDLIVFESNDALNLQKSDDALKSAAVKSFSSSCLSCRNGNFCLHLKVPPPSLLFVEKNMVIVMLSHIVTPHEFYVNMAMENIDTLDELLEKMTCTYESRIVSKVEMDDLEEGMYCAARFREDSCWYRVKIIRISEDDKNKDQVLGHYIDYGNISAIHCSDLRPLSTEFAAPSEFAIKCTLAGVKPIQSENSDGQQLYWGDDAIDCFKKLTSFGRCLTAQICSDLLSNENDAYPVLLWDTEDSVDLLINKSLADQKMAIFDNNLLHSAFKKTTEVMETSTALEHWNPMDEAYHDLDNNYANDDEDIQIRTTGYRARDEEYVCKYFSTRGYCPRGSHCKFEHLPVQESGVTYDQEEVFCLDSVQMISDRVSNVLVQISSIITPSHFYAVLPFGCKTVDDIDNLVFEGYSYDKIINSEAKILFYELNEHYSNTSFDENTNIALSCGTIVAARRKWDGKWHRGRITDVAGIKMPSKIFFVDSGDQEWVPRKFIRTILPQFLYTPFQAVQCSLHGIEPVASVKESSWSPEAVNYFKNIVEGEILLAEIVNRCGVVFYVSLRKTSKNDHSDVAQRLITAGYAWHVQHTPNSHPQNKKEAKYVPG